MIHRILTVRVTAQGLTLLRDRTRQVGELFGLDKLDCTRFITAVSEIARNTVEYAGEGTLALLSLKDRQAELELADERKNQFVATLAHELRNPLATLQMTLGILRRVPAAQVTQIEARYAVMERQTRQLSQLVDDLMDASRV